MNKFSVARFAAFSLILLAGLSLCSGARAQTPKNAAGEEFFIVSSVDVQNSQLLLKRASEVTLLMKVNGKTQYFDEKGNAIHLSDLRAGDTVWLLASGTAAQQPVAVRIRKGPMTVAELHRDYLGYPEIK